MNCELNTINNQAVITIIGEIPLLMATEIKALLDQAMTSANVIIIQIKDMSYVDLSFLQLIYAAQKKCLANNKHIVFHDSCVEQLKQYVQEAGFSHAITIKE
ncbi:MAG: Sulfate transporter/antisigma-factor antagonist STAS [Candidatus Magnetoglobus multicellularis str. Araruama]|uniref:Sulfate transporter/antisigma-factor antagonist STAS n=1 Tax=Candidatus Magnetoglobus multicellularis str. Araruama TaxID=890399 RepID=A0A1V1PG96_9BACT|nr:MAG: Sulfate transporter/antisigma-factor antagonist STAS [Candidatus Magnetoglobus multicellularis str. Araruama]